MRRLLFRLGLLVAVVLLLGAVGAAWATVARDRRLSQHFDVHDIDLPTPWPLTAGELEELRRAGSPDTEEAVGPEAPADPLDGVDLQALAARRAVVRGKHLVEARFACVECHGRDFSGGVMVDDPAMGTWKGPNLTQGEGSRTVGYTVADWDHIVRHGVKGGGEPAIMPSEDFVDMSDRELSDIIAYIATLPPIDNDVPPPRFGPIGTLLTALGKLPLSAERHHGGTEHMRLPPNSADTVEFGRHLAQTCTGCHRVGLNGGPIAVGPPGWPPAGNLTSHEQGTEGWSFDDFVRALREGERPDGSAVRAPMTIMAPYAARMTEVELRALWTYIQSLPPQPTGV